MPSTFLDCNLPGEEAYLTSRQVAKVCRCSMSPAPRASTDHLVGFNSVSNKLSRLSN